MALRRAGQAAQRLMSMQNSGGLLQKRFAGDLPAKTNKYIEDWGAFRENVEFTYRWDGRTWRNLAIFAVVVPYTIYTITCAEFDRADAKYDRPQRDMMGDSK